MEVRSGRRGKEGHKIERIEEARRQQEKEK